MRHFAGFVAFVAGWNSIREEDRGLLWEHAVLDTLRMDIEEKNLYYWRDKSDREIDCSYPKKGKSAHF